MPAAWVRRAASQYGLLLERLEPLAERLSNPGIAPLQAREAETVAALEQIAELDAEAFASLRRAPEADYPPTRR